MAVLLANAAAAQTYSAVDLGNLGKGAPVGINNSGQVAGTLQTTDLHAFLYSNGTINDLGILTLSDSSYSFGFGINRAGQVVGVSGTEQTFHAFLYSDGSLIDLDPNDFQSAATGINSLGQIAGYAAATSGDSYFAALFSGGQAINLGAIAGSTSCQAQFINDNGQVVGICDVGGGSSFHAFLYNRGNVIDLGTLAGPVDTLSSSANAINNRGQVVGFSDVAAGESHAFLYSGGAMTDLGVLTGYSGSVAAGINNLGQVVGWLIPSDSMANDHAFLYSGGTMMDLNSLVTMPSGVSLLQAEGINDAGQIAALGSDGHAYLLTYTNSQLSVLNPFAPYVTTQTAPQAVNVESMLTAPSPAQNLAADGESALALVYKSASPHAVTFNLSTPGSSLPSGASAGSLGAFQPDFLTAPQPTTGVISLLVPKSSFGPDVDGNYYFVALLWAPAAMPIANTPVMPLMATATQAGQPVGQARINLEPPPLLLVHGIWASAASADFTPGSGGLYDYIAGLYPHNLIFPVDYGTINDRSFADPGVQNIFLSGLEDALASAAETGIAARTVDVVAHSMGGLVARYFTTNPIAEPILLRNPVHKLITVGTPHSGTPLATTLVNNAALTTNAGAEVAAWCAFTSPCSLGGVMSALGESPSTGAASMEPGSPALGSLSSSNLFSAMSGVGPSPAATTEGLLDVVIGAFLPGATVTNTLAGSNDTLATTSSQTPPTAADSALPVTGVVSSSLCGSCDLGEMASPEVWAQAYYWLTGGTGTAPAGNGPAGLAPEPRTSRPRVSAGPAPVLNLTGYAQVLSSNVTFQPASGSTLTINAANSITATSATKTITEVLLLQTVSDPTDIAFFYATESPFSIAFTPTRLGTANFGAITVFDDHTYALTTLTYPLQTSGAPYALGLLNAPVTAMIAGSTRIVGTQAMFSNGPMNVTQAATYTTLSHSTSVIGIGSNGTITANSPGVDSLMVSYEGLTATAPVVVGACTYSLGPANQIVPATGGNVAIEVTTQPGCIWAAGGSAPWLTLTQANGTGSGTVTLTAAPNSSNSPQSAIVALGGLSAIVTQPASACSYHLSQNQIDAPAAGLSGSIAVTTTCPVIASSDQTWLSAAPAGAAVAYTAMPNGTPFSRTATLTIGTVDVPVSQSGFVCAVSGNGSVSVTDVQQVVNEALGTAGAGNDLNGDKAVNVVDLQIVVNAAMGLGCTG